MLLIDGSMFLDHCRSRTNRACY